MGSIGPNRVNVFETHMGPFGYGGSASTAMRAMSVTRATGIIQLGMAFGAYPTLQAIGDFVVSSSIVAYDYRTVREAPGGNPPYKADYADPNNPTPRFEARESLLNLFANAADDPGGDFRVHVGMLLSGGARIQSASYRDYLLRFVPSGDRPFVGGEMEGVGLPPANVDPAWILVKGISDFADGADPDSFPARRAMACNNAAGFVLRTLTKLTEKLQ
jgi:adenosylhomocysteine nucleosidase